MTSMERKDWLMEEPIPGANIDTITMDTDTMDIVCLMMTLTLDSTSSLEIPKRSLESSLGLIPSQTSLEDQLLTQVIEQLNTLITLLIPQPLQGIIDTIVEVTGIIPLLLLQPIIIDTTDRTPCFQHLIPSFPLSVGLVSEEVSMTCFLTVQPFHSQVLEEVLVYLRQLPLLALQEASRRRQPPLDS